MQNVVPLGKAGLRESFDWYVSLAEKAAQVSQQRQRAMLLVIDHTGIVAAAERPPERRHWVVAEFTFRVDPDALAKKIETMAIEKGFDEGRRKGRKSPTGGC